MDRIRIKGYKSFKEQEVELKQINILIGANGSGKSNFLSFYELLNRLYEQKLKEYVALNGGSDKMLHNGSELVDEIEATMFFGSDSYSFTLKKGVDHFVFMKEEVSYKGIVTDINSLKNEAQIKTYSELSQGWSLRRYLSDIKKYHFHDTGKNSPFSQQSNINNDIFFLYEKGNNLAAYLYKVREEHPLVYNRIIKVIQSIAPYFSDFYFAPSSSELLRLLWQDKYSSMIYGINDLSDGTLRFIALTTLFLQPILPGLIIIDEPELGLHPFAIQKLAGMIKAVANKGTQVIVATQSSDLVNLFQPEDILTVNQINGETVLRRLSAGDLSDWLEEYALGDLWKQNILKGGQPR